MTLEKDLRTYVVIGAGPAGLMAAYTLAKNKKRTILLETDAQVGGLAKTLQKGDLKYDLGPHNLHSIYPEIIQQIKNFLNNKIEEHKITSKIYFRGKIVPYPLTGVKVFTSIPLYLALMAGIDFIFTRLRRRLFLYSSNDDSFKEWIMQRFGGVLYKIYFQPYASKVWKIDPDNLSKIVAEKRIPILSLFGLIRRIILGGQKFHPEDSTQIYNFYPKGGVGMLMKKIESEILENGSEIICNTKIEEVLLSSNKVIKIRYKDKDGNEYEKENVKLISTIPLNSLVSILEGINSKTVEKSKLLDYCSMRLFYMVVNKGEILDVPWIYFSDDNVIFNRVSDMAKFSKTLVVDGKTILCFEISCRINDELWESADDKIFEKIITVLEKYNLLQHKDVETFFSEYINHSYPLFFKGFEKTIESILLEIEKLDGLITIGRQGLYTYANIDDAMKMGIVAAKHISQGNIKMNYKRTFGNYLFY